MLWSLYMIRCGDGTLYTGIAKDVDRRFSEHLGQGSKSAKYVRGRLPLELVYRCEVGARSEAIKEELRIKALNRQKKLALVAKGGS
jgi:putative endonuclease